MDNVKDNRHLYIGGSDIPIIMGISPFKSRWDLLLEKLQVKENTFIGNEYTEYGNILEPQIRDYINVSTKDKYVVETLVKGDLRGNVDGVNKTTILEIKTSSNPKNSRETYIVQLLMYMVMYNKKKGVLAMYTRTDINDTTFNALNLEVEEINIKDYKESCKRINEAIEKFRKDLNTLQGYLALGYELTQELITNNELVELSNKVAILENELIAFKELEKQQTALKEELKNAMISHNIKKWEMENGTKITLVDESVTIKKVVDEDKLKKENEELYKKCLIDKETKRSAFIKITLPKV